LLILIKENNESANEKVYRSNVNISSNATISECFSSGFFGKLKPWQSLEKELLLHMDDVSSCAEESFTS